MAVWGLGSFKGGTGKSAVDAMTAHVLAHAGYTVTNVDAGLNPDQGNRARVQLSQVPMRVPTLDKDTWPATWWTDPSTGYQLLPGSPYPELRNMNRITEDTIRAVRRVRDQRDFVFVDLPPTQSVEPNPAMFAQVAPTFTR